MNTTSSARVPRLVTLVLCAAGCVAGCASGQPQVPENSGAPSRHVAVVVATATRNEPAPVPGPRMRQQLADLGEREDDAVALVVRSEQETLRVGLTPRRPNGRVEHGPRRATLLAGNVARVGDETARVAPGREGLDLLRLLQVVPRVSATPGLLLVISSGLSTEPPLDLRVVGWEADPPAVAGELSRDGFLPDLRGWRVSFAGLGNVTGEQPALPEPQRRTLVAYWLAICRAAGAADCASGDESGAAQPSRSPLAVPTVPVPAVVSVRGPRGVLVHRLPAPLLFAVDSARLAPGADEVLLDVVRDAAGNGMRVTGHTDATTGTPAHNLELSRARAAAVARRLRDLGATAGQIVSVSGVGAAGTSPAAERTGGRVDPAKVSARRFVAVEFVTAPGKEES